MGFGGAIGMITSLKNNSRKKDKPSFNGLGKYNNQSQAIPSKPISEKALTKIRNTIKKEQQQLTIKRISITFFILSILVFFIIILDTKIKL